jgi:acyl transferase domain-containing protein
MSGPPPETAEGTGIAICGMAGRFPGAPDLDRFWANLCQGKESITRFSAEELLAAGEDEERLADPNYVKARPILDEVERFDAAFFGITPREAEILDPQHRLFLECAWEALEQAGCDTERAPGAISLFAGASFSNYLVRNIYGNRPVLDAFGDVAATILNVQDSLVTMAGYKLNLRGPCCAVQTFCSTSLVAVHLACQSLLNFESDLALAGGVSVNVPQQRGYLFQEGGIVSPDGRCRTFDARARGTVFGNGVGVVVLKRLSDAREQGDPVCAVIRGSAINNDGALKASFGAPGVVGQTEVIVEALAAAGVDPDTIGYVEAHGTGTLLGDPAELSALTKAYRRRGATRRAFCAIGSMKTNVGHLDAAAGVAGLIKTALSLEHGRIPPSLNFETPNPEIDFASSPFFVNTALRDWTGGEGPRRGAVSAFGVGGTNAHVVLEQAPAVPPPERGRAEQLLVLSAKTKTALEQAARNLAAHLRAHPEADLADVAWTLQVGRRGFAERWVAVGRDTAEAIALLEGGGSEEVGRATQERRKPPVAFVFPGGPAPRPNTGRALYEGEAPFREAIGRCAAEARGLLGEDIALLLYPPPDRQAEARERLREPALAEAALFALQYGLARLWRGWGLLPEAMAGFGSGEFVAGYLAEALPLGAALRLAVEHRHAAAPPSTKALETLAARADCLLLELGPEPVLVDLLRKAWGNGASPRLTLSCLHAPEERVSSVRQALATMGRLWLAGVQPDWAALQGPARRRRVRLPSYPFERQRYWVDPLPKDEPAAETGPRKASSLARWLHQPAWKTSLASPASSGTPAGRWLIFADEQGIGAALAEHLRAGKAEAMVVAAGSGFGGDPRSGYRVDPGRGPDYDALVEDLRRRGALPSRVVHLWSVDSPDASAPFNDRFTAASERGLFSLLHLLQALERPPGIGPLELTVVSSGLHDVIGREPLSPEKAPLLALALVAPQEYHDLRCRSLDLESGPGDPAVVGATLLGELASGALDPVVAYRGAKRWTRLFEPLPNEESEGPLARVRPEGTYLITGGLGNVGFVAAAALARAGRTKLVLLGRSSLPPREGWSRWLPGHPPGDATSVRIRRIQALEEWGAEVLALAADVGDPRQVQRAVSEARARFGDIHGVIHAAGLLGPESFAPIQDLSRADCERLFAAKVRGLLALEEALAEPALDFWLLTSSLSTVLGGFGYAAYAGGNAFLDHFAAERGRRAPGRWISVDFDQWRFAGGDRGGVPGGDDPAATAITPPEGLRLLEHLLRLGASGQVVVSTTPLGDRLARWVGPGDRGPRPVTAVAAGASVLRPRPALATAYVAPRDEPERTLAGMFEELLGVGPVGIHDNFFELGGHSLFAARALSRVRTAFDIALPLSAFFEAPTVAVLALRVATALAGRRAAADAGAPAADRVEIEL